MVSNLACRNCGKDLRKVGVNAYTTHAYQGKWAYMHGGPGFTFSGGDVTSAQILCGYCQHDVTEQIAAANVEVEYHDAEG